MYVFMPPPRHGFFRVHCPARRTPDATRSPHYGVVGAGATALRHDDNTDGKPPHSDDMTGLLKGTGEEQPEKMDSARFSLLPRPLMAGME